MNKRINKRRVKIANEKGNSSNSWFNCWGATLYVLNAIDKLDWVDNEDIVEFIENETKAIKEEEISVGDILVLYGTRYGVGVHGIIHTAVCTSVDENDCELFHKKGGGQAEFTNLEGVRTSYSAHSKYEIVRKTAPLTKV
jgi:hypothetical protein